MRVSPSLSWRKTEPLIGACLGREVMDWASWPKFNYIIALVLMAVRYIVQLIYGIILCVCVVLYWTVRVRRFREVLVFVFYPG